MQYFDGSFKKIKDKLNEWRTSEKENVSTQTQQEQQPKKEEKTSSSNNNFLASIQNIQFDNINFNNPTEIVSIV